MVYKSMKHIYLYKKESYVYVKIKSQKYVGH